MKIKRFIHDLMNPRYWYFVYLIKNILFKTKDYDRLEHDYSCVLDYATMSKTNYDLNTIYSENDYTQSEFHYSIVKQDLTEILDGGDINNL